MTMIEQNVKRLLVIVLACHVPTCGWAQQTSFHATNPQTGQSVSGSIDTPQDTTQQFTFWQMRRTLESLQQELQAARQAQDWERLEAKLKAEEKKIEDAATKTTSNFQKQTEDPVLAVLARTREFFDKKAGERYKKAFDIYFRLGADKAQTDPEYLKLRAEGDFLARLGKEWWENECRAVGMKP